MRHFPVSVCTLLTWLAAPQAYAAHHHFNPGVSALDQVHFVVLAVQGCGR